MQRSTTTVGRFAFYATERSAMTNSGARLLGAITQAGPLLQYLEQVKRLVWLIETGEARFTVALVPDPGNNIACRVAFNDGTDVLGMADSLVGSLADMFAKARESEGPLA